MNKCIIALLTLAFTSASAIAVSKIMANHTHEEGKWSHGAFDTGHSGGLDKNGGHYDRQNGGYHYHR